MNYYLVMIRKLPFYLHSLTLLLRNLKNPYSLIKLILKQETLLNFNNGLSFFVSQPIDALIAKETLIDDTYGLRTQTDLKRIIDVGAAFGDFSLYANQLFRNAEIIAFEPNPESFRLFSSNIKINRAKNINAYQLAIGTSPEITLYIGHDNVQGSQIASSEKNRSVKVVCQPLSKYIKGDIDLLKVDTEGAELQVLSSINNSQFAGIKKIICEYHNHLVVNQDKEIIKFLEAHDYKVEQVKDKYYPSIGYISASR